MALTQPGTYVLYNGFDSESPWPAMIYVDEYAPPDVQRSRPSGYVTLVLLLGEPYSFQWAHTRQLSPFVSAEEAGISTPSGRLLQAYKAAEFMRDTKLGLEYWRTVVDEHCANSATELESEVVGTEEELDEQLQEALRISRDQYYNSSHQDSRTLSLSQSPPKRIRRATSVITLDDDSDLDLELYEQPRARPSRLHNARSDSFKQGQRLSTNKVNANCSSNSALIPEASKTKHQKNGRISTQDILGWGNLGQSSTTPTSDVIDGHLSASRDFVQLRVGPGLDVRTLHKKDVWDRPYFKDTRTGINYFTFNEEDNWELRHPCFTGIEVDDFQFVAEYLTDGAFGIRYPEGAEQNKDAIAQCVSAWETAEKIGMADMLEHIAEKVKFIEWDNEDVLSLAILIYRTSGPIPHAHEMMRDWISTYLAYHYWGYIKDDALRDIFIKRLRNLPELERDVTVKRGQDLAIGAEADENAESDEDEIGDDDL